jgi:hypothetical protein
MRSKTLKNARPWADRHYSAEELAIEAHPLVGVPSI